MNAPTPLPPDLLELLEAERDIDPPSSAVRERTYARLAPILATAAGALGADPHQDVEPILPDSPPPKDSDDEHA